MSEAFDLSQFELLDTAILTVQDISETGDLLGTDGEPITIELYGPGSAVVRDAMRESMRRKAAL